jgi:protein TonB
MFRALLISISLHLMMLLSPIFTGGAMGPSFSAKDAVLGVTLRHAAGVGKALVAQHGGVLPDKTLAARVVEGGALAIKPKGASERPASALVIEATPGDLQMDGREEGPRVPSEARVHSTEGEQEYRLNVSREARRFRRYPPIARERGWEGVAVVTVSMTLAAASPVVSLERSSGYDELDSQALEMMAAAVRLASLPEGMRGRRFAISLPVEYRLAE